MSHIRWYPDWILSEQYVKYISCSDNIKLQNGTTFILARIWSQWIMASGHICTRYFGHWSSEYVRILHVESQILHAIFGHIRTTSVQNISSEMDSCHFWRWFVTHIQCQDIVQIWPLSIFQVLTPDGTKVKYFSCSENIKLQNGTTFILARIWSQSHPRFYMQYSDIFGLPVSKISRRKWIAVISGDDS